MKYLYISFAILFISCSVKKTERETKGESGEIDAMCFETAAPNGAAVGVHFESGNDVPSDRKDADEAAGTFDTMGRFAKREIVWIVRCNIVV